MSYQVLARKWRPNQFSEVIGQEHVITALSNALTNQRLHHAYLFSGTRGVGKTSIARLFAKGLNCETGITATPCGQCENCRAIKDGNFIDLIEIDAASRTKVEDTRELLDNVQYKPVRGRFKIYLIDEVHMLSRHSFNALLKTLEEPPEYVKFLLATTDPQKLPITVLSRCIQFHLKALDANVIAEHLAKLLTQEHISYQRPALDKIAQAAQGSVRDSLSLTDQAIALSNGNVTVETVNAMLGLLDSHKSVSLLRAIAQADGESAMQILYEIAEQGVDWDQVLQDLAETLHQIAMLQLLPPKQPQIDSALDVLAKTISAEDVQFYYQLMLSGRKELELAPEARSGVEMTILRALAFHPKRLLEPVIVKKNVQSSESSIIEHVESQQSQPAFKTATQFDSESTTTLTEDPQPVTPSPTNQQRSSALLSSDILQQVASLEQQKKEHLSITAEKKNDFIENVIHREAIAEVPVDQMINVTEPLQSSDAEQVTPQQAIVTFSEPDFSGQDETVAPLTASTMAEVVDNHSVEVDETTDNDLLNEDYHWSWSDPSLAQQQVMRPSEIKKALLEKYTPEVIANVVKIAGEQSAWSAEIEQLGIAGVSKQILLNSVVLARDDESIQLGVRPKSFFLAKNLDLSFIHNAFQTFYGRKIKIELTEYSGEEVTPYEIRGQIYQQMVDDAQQKLQQDQKLTQFIQQFSAKIDLDSVRPIGKV